MGGLNNKEETIIASEKDKISELYIYICGNKKEINLFNKKEIIRDNYIQNYDNFEEKHPNYDWYFNYNFQELNEDSINKILNNIINDYRAKKNFKNNLILIFFESNTLTESDIKKVQMILSNIDKMHKVYKPILLFAFKKEILEIDEEKVEKKSDEDAKRIMNEIIKENKFDNKFIEIAYYNENDYSEILKKINSAYCYYNNIGDLFTVLDEMIRGYNFYSNTTKSKIKFASTFNILVIGRPGGGKSTLINLLLNERKAREGIGESVTKVVSKYIHDKYPITFEDTPGFEDNKDLEKMLNFLRDSNDFFGKGKNKFHLILYIINGSNERTFIGEEVKLINFIQNYMNIPLFFVCTRCKNEDFAKDFEEVIKMNLWQNFGDKTSLVNNIYCCHLLNEKDGIYKRFGISELLIGIQKFYLKELEKKEKEFLLNKGSQFPLEIINNTNDNFSSDSIFLTGLKSPEYFEDYLNKLSIKIIERYEYLTYLEGERHKKMNNDDNNDEDLDKINELLVDHLAMELNGKSKGYIFCKRNKNQVEENIKKNEVIETNWRCKTKTQDIYLRNGKIVSDESIKYSIRKTNEFGIEAKKEFLNLLRYNNGFALYLEEIINNYKEAIESLTKLDKQIEE